MIAQSRGRASSQSNGALDIAELMRFIALASDADL